MLGKNNQCEDWRLLADRYEVRQRRSEPSGLFRARVALTAAAAENDPCLAVEVVTGKPDKEFGPEEEQAVMSLALRMVKQRRQVLMSVGDTYHTMPFTSFCALAEVLGFERVVEKDIRYFGTPDTVNEFYVWVRRKEAMLMTASSSREDDKVINSAMLMYELSGRIDGKVPNNLECDILHSLLDGSSFGYLGSYSTGVGAGPAPAYSVVRDVREGLVRHLQSLQESPFKTNAPWVYYAGHDLFHLVDNATCERLLNPHCGGDYANPAFQDVKCQAINSLPTDVKHLIGFKP